MAVFTSAVGAAGILGRDRLADTYSFADIALGGTAVHKLSRIIAKESVASPLRAPFTRLVGPTGSAELHEEPRAGARRTIGELITCPFCLAPWLAALYVAGLTVAPKITRAVAALFAAVAVSDGLQHLSARLSID